MLGMSYHKFSYFIDHFANGGDLELSMNFKNYEMAHTDNYWETL